MYEKFKKTFKIPMDSDAVFHEEAEYIIGFKITVSYDELSSIFRKKMFFLCGTLDTRTMVSLYFTLP